MDYYDLHCAAECQKHVKFMRTAPERAERSVRQPQPGSCGHANVFALQYKVQSEERK